MINTDKLNAYILDPSDPIKNYEVALEYYEIKNYSAAGCFFLRTVFHLCRIRKRTFKNVKQII